jgi:hypothetical protein
MGSGVLTMSILKVLTGVTTGYIEDDPDGRDILLSADEEKLPAAASIKFSGFVRVRQAGGSCTGAAIAHAIQGAYLHRGAACPALSGLHNYYFGRMQWQTKLQDTGSQLRYGIRGARSYGICSEKIWSNSLLRVNKAPTWAALRDGYHRRGIRGYYRIRSGDLDGCRLAISKGFPIVAGWDVDRSIEKHKAGEILEPMAREEGHAMTVFAYGATGTWFGPNTWPSSWGVNGWWTGSDDFMRAAHDIWAIDIEDPK